MTHGASASNKFWKLIWGSGLRSGFPTAKPGQTIGLLGGSFDPPHEGHVHISDEAIKRFGLDHIWWLVSPGNPLKPKGPAPIEQRITAAKALINDPRVVVSDVEAHIGTRFTAETLDRLLGLYPGVRFVWLMGADNLAQFHLWERWDDIMETVPIGVLARPGSRMSARFSKASSRYERWRVPSEASHLLPHMPAPAWCFINVPMRAVSSTAIRAKGGWNSKNGA